MLSLFFGVAFSQVEGDHPEKKFVSKVGIKIFSNELDLQKSSKDYYAISYGASKYRMKASADTICEVDRARKVGLVFVADL